MNNLTPDEWRRIEKILEQVLDLPPAARDEHVERACGNDRWLQAEVKAFLEADARSVRFMKSHVRDSASTLMGEIVEEVERQEAGRVQGELVGSFRIVREIGRGGMAIVYLAARADRQFEQEVALKIMKPGMDTAEVLRQFEQERQILASLNHPNIARLLDGGATRDGRPYIAMEYVEGRPIQQFCDDNRLTVTERIRLLVTVGRAVQYAHRNLVVHRDLKPSNILVTDEGILKLLDFGIAKLLGPAKQADAAPLTRRTTRLMTPEYASPEQVRGEPVTTASDVYQLGLLLYELLTGSRPYRIRDRTPAEMERVICADEQMSTHPELARAATWRGKL